MLDKKSKEEIKILRQGGKILHNILHTVAKKVDIGITGIELNNLAEEMIKKAGGKPAFKNYKGYPAGLCVSINQTVVHGIPNNTPFKNGDLIGLDLGMEYKGLFTDMAITVPVGEIDKQAKKLLDVTKKALEIGISEVGPDKYIGDIGKAIEKYIKPYGYGIVRDLAGHGVGLKVHEDHNIPNYNPGSKLEKMFSGLVIAIEPMIVMGGTHEVVVADNKWDISSKDNSLTAHFEHTVAVTEDSYKIITAE